MKSTASKFVKFPFKTKLKQATFGISAFTVGAASGVGIAQSIPEAKQLIAANAYTDSERQENDSANDRQSRHTLSQGRAILLRTIPELKIQSILKDVY